MTAARSKEARTIFKDILEARDVEKYRQYIGYDDKTEAERDLLMLEFESMCRSHHKEWGSPADIFTHRMQGILHIAAKHGIDPLTICGEFAGQLERRHK